MPEIVPAIIAKSFDELKEKIKLVEPYVKSVQIDIMDGVFVPEKTWNCPEELKNVSTNLEIEMHLMVKDVESEIERWLDSEVKRILVHIEVLISNVKSQNSLIPKELQEAKRLVGNLQHKCQNLIEKCHTKNVEFGIVLNLKTSIDVLDDMRYAISDMPVIQLMSIAKIGEHGQPFDERVIPKIRALREMFPDVKIQADGGINIENAKQVVETGADVLVIGSAIFNNKDVGGAIEEFEEIANKQ